MILVCDDEAPMRYVLEQALEPLGETVTTVPDARAALPLLGEAEVLLTDLVMPGMDGFELLARVRQEEPDLPVVLVTARGNERTAMRAVREGAWDYLAKPFAVDELRTVVKRALEARRLRRAAAQLETEQGLGRPLVGQSPAFRKVVEQARRVARRDVTVLVRGETGTGKELIASLLHVSSPRKTGPLVRFNCASIAPELAEAELFGHTKGAFTGANEAKTGFFKRAHGGTLVLDEVGELPAGVQASLLRALQEGEIQPVGASRVEKVDVRVIACTHRDLKAEAAAGRFREDLYYRLAVVELALPSLAERKSDVPLLVEAFRRTWAQRFGLDEVSFSPALVDALAARPWPGNVRELENTVARLLTLSDGGVIGLEALEPAAATARRGPESLRAQVDAFERSVIARVLEETRHNQSETARRLGLSRATLIDKLDKHGLR
ncbi:MAG: sigma-54 dependent transcriptional regulator [Myxococcaceae bacterium]